MALTKCFECGHEVSTAAAACPNCGAPLAADSARPHVIPTTQPPPAPDPDKGIFGRTKTYLLKLPRIIQIGWICLIIGIVFTAVLQVTFWGVIAALVLGVVAFFGKQRRHGLILTAAASLTLIVMLVIFAFSVADEMLSHKQRHFTPKQKLVNELTISFRESLLDTTQVLRIRNPNRESIDFYLKCYAQNGSSKTLFVSVPALQTTEIGLLEGWQFKPGERFEAICDDDVIWRSEVK